MSTKRRRARGERWSARRSLVVAVAALLLPAAWARADGACCFPSGACLTGNETFCVSLGGVFQGDDVACAPGLCPVVGACCFDDGSCDRVNEDECGQAGGTYQGEDSVCDPNDCPQPTGACCLIDGTCAALTALDCAAAGGAYEGDGMSCTAVDCPEPTGACCFVDGGCQTLTEDECDMAGADYAGDGSTCDPNDCPQPTGACCFDDGSCQVLTSDDCAAAGSAYQGDDTACSPNPCPQPTGACCLPDGACATLAQDDCGAAGAAYQGDDTSCDAVDCPQPTGACCYPDGACAVLTEDACGGDGGTYTADGTDCIPNECPQPTGACCFPEGSCIVATQAECSAADGDYQGADTDCDPNLCPDLLGACCLPDGSCLTTTDAQCAAEGGAFQGVDASCDGVDCPQPTGACCFEAGSCTELTRDVCELEGGDYEGDFTTCPSGICNERSHPGWNWVDNLIMLTKNEPTYWSALTGQPKGVSPFEVLDPPGPGGPGRPDPEGSTDRVLRGYIIAYAIDANGEEIRWNHLKADATIVDYRDDSAWEYNAWSFAAVDAAVANGAPTGTPGVLNLDGVEYAMGFDQLLLDFQASGSTGFSGPVDVVIDTDLTLLPIDADLRQETDGPVTTKASFTVWNQNEVKFSGLDRCITCWDQALVSGYGVPNHLLRANLQTDKGKARIDGLASHLCDHDNDPKDGLAIGADPNDVVSRAASLLGVSAKILDFGPGLGRATAGMNLHGLGTQAGVIRVDVLGLPPEAGDPAVAVERLLEDLLRLGGLGADAPRSTRTSPQGGPAGVAPVDRVSGTEKGSLLIIPKIELRWDAEGRIVRDTFVDMSNDFPEDVRVQMYFINGDAPLP